MIKKIQALLAIALVFTLIACEKDFEELNKNPFKPTQVEIGPLFNSVIQSLTLGWNEQLYLNNETIYKLTQQAALSATTFQNVSIGTEEVWSRYYAALSDIRDIESRMDNFEDDQEATNNVRAMLKVVLAYKTFRLSDLFGGMPFFDAGKGFENLELVRPKFDTQEAIYKALLDDLKWVNDNANINPAPTTAAGEAYISFNGFDQLFNEDMAMWVKFANSLRLRHAIRMVEKEPTLANEIIKEILENDLPLIEAGEEVAMWPSKLAWRNEGMFWSFIISGPATVSGTTVSLTGTVGEVMVRSMQGGDGTYDPAIDVINSFQVLDPQTFVPVIDDRSPVAGSDVWVPELGPIQLASIATIDYPDLFSVDDVVFEINGTQIDAKDWGNDHYTAWWTPSAYGTYAMNIIATNNYGATNTEVVNFTVVDQMADVSVNAATEVHLYVNTGEETVEAILPSYMGAFDEIIANLDIDCPAGGCDEWDRVSGIEVKGHNGEWYEVIRYITPYGKACNHSVDLTDFMSLLQGKVDFRFYLGTVGNGFLYTLDLDYGGGVPTHKYSTIDKLWNDYYDFGNPADLQPTDTKGGIFPANVSASKIKLVSTGHGWGNNNTGNAAEFHNDTHHIWINGAETFAQNNWLDCDPNPDGCNDQFGTWEFDRAGWCPGAIAPWFDFDMTQFISSGNVSIRYVFDEDYVDLCNVNNPDCVSGVTCNDCTDGFNPHLIVASYLISLGDEPLEDGTIVGTEQANLTDFSIYPNPSSGLFNIEFDESIKTSEVRVLNNMGQVLRSYNDEARTNVRVLNLQDLPNGIYFVELITEQGRGLKKITISK